MSYASSESASLNYKFWNQYLFFYPHSLEFISPFGSMEYIKREFFLINLLISVKGIPERKNEVWRATLVDTYIMYNVKIILPVERDSGTFTASIYDPRTYIEAVTLTLKKFRGEGGRKGFVEPKSRRKFGKGRSLGSH